jgi:hypothetical protein
VTTCPRCGDLVEQGQEYCVECGLRLPGEGPVGMARDPGAGWIARSLLGLVVALAGAAVAVAATNGDDTSSLRTATGGFARAPVEGSPETPEVSSDTVIDWPLGEDGWTIALASFPQTGGRKVAVARAREARRRELPSVGVLDSSRYASLHPGYWIVFTGVYSSEAEATSALGRARAFSRTANVRPVVR